MLVNYFTGIYKRNKHWAEISDESCMRSGCHVSITFANRLLDKAYQLLEEGLISVGAAEKLPAFEKETNIVPGECSGCHTGIEQKVTTAFGWKFSHFIHLKGQGLSCTRCHSNARKHGELVISKQECMDCHHGELAGGKLPECKNCHGTQYAVYFSQVAFSTLKVPNPISGVWRASIVTRMRRIACCVRGKRFAQNATRRIMKPCSMSGRPAARSF